MVQKNQAQVINDIDENYSQRFIQLDPKGYFIIKLNSESSELIVEHFSNDINENGIATDPITGEPIKCTGISKRTPTKIFKGKSAKELGIKITEENPPLTISKLDHALYLGRELQKAEDCLINGKPYIQD
ncbi:DUF4346 domain-containing protein [Prochlorococcus marinus]|uniref:DUF4346 domain-containing protein n=1 Tax=Prochlorococcus marinus TaxID=1219 RepID=UPI0022B45050|nr:DUF4346 domain-containing protein [Prochlorococcus marinus]